MGISACQSAKQIPLERKHRVLTFFRVITRSVKQESKTGSHIVWEYALGRSDRSSKEDKLSWWWWKTDNSPHSVLKAWVLCWMEHSGRIILSVARKERWTPFCFTYIHSPRRINKPAFISNCFYSPLWHFIEIMAILSKPRKVRGHHSARVLMRKGF